MFPRVTTIRQGNNTYRYLQILEAHRDQGRIRQRVVANLGRVDHLAGRLDRLVDSLAKYCNNKLVAAEMLECQQSLVWGPILLARWLWEQMNLSGVVKKHCGSFEGKFDIAERAFVLVANRLCDPVCEHGLARWLEHTFVCNRRGRRWKPDWLPAKRISGQKRLEVNPRQVKQWRWTLSALLSAKEKIQESLYFRVLDLFDVKADRVFYYLTSAYYYRTSLEGELHPIGLSEDETPNRGKLVIGVMMVNGFPIAHHVFPGNTPETTTLDKFVKSVQRRFGFGRITVVFDRGLIGLENLEFCSLEPYSVLLGVSAQQCDEAFDIMAAIDSKWQQIDDNNRVCEVHIAGKTCRYFVIDNDDRGAYEAWMRLYSTHRAKAQLQKFAEAAKADNLDDSVEIGARASRPFVSHDGCQHYSLQLTGPGQSNFFEDPEKLQAGIIPEGKYIFKTYDKGITAAEVVTAYEGLDTINQGFRHLKDVIGLGWMHGTTNEAIEGYIFLAVLALLLKGCLQYRLSSKLPALSASEALAAMQSIGIAELGLESQTKCLVSDGGRDARRILTAFGITEINPPGIQSGFAERSRKPRQ